MGGSGGEEGQLARLTAEALRVPYAGSAAQMAVHATREEDSALLAGSDRAPQRVRALPVAVGVEAGVPLRPRGAGRLRPVRDPDDRQCPPWLLRELYEGARLNSRQIGAILGSFESWLLLRGMRTLFPRVKASAAAAQRIAEHFAGHQYIAQVLYPGLPDFVGHAVAARQMRGGYGGMLSLRIKGGEQAAIGVAAKVKLWKRATSLGGTESLVEHRASVEGANSPCPPDLLRLSAGIEDVADLIADLEQALKP